MHAPKQGTKSMYELFSGKLSPPRQPNYRRCRTIIGNHYVSCKCIFSSLKCFFSCPQTIAEYITPNRNDVRTTIIADYYGIYCRIISNEWIMKYSLKKANRFVPKWNNKFILLGNWRTIAFHEYDKQLWTPIVWVFWFFIIFLLIYIFEECGNDLANNIVSASQTLSHTIFFSGKIFSTFPICICF